MGVFVQQNKPKRDYDDLIIYLSGTDFRNKGHQEWKSNKTAIILPPELSTQVQICEKSPLI